MDWVQVTIQIKAIMKVLSTKESLMVSVVLSTPRDTSTKVMSSSEEPMDMAFLKAKMAHTEVNSRTTRNMEKGYRKQQTLILMAPSLLMRSMKALSNTSPTFMRVILLITFSMGRGNWPMKREFTLGNSLTDSKTVMESLHGKMALFIGEISSMEPEKARVNTTMLKTALLQEDTGLKVFSMAMESISIVLGQSISAYGKTERSKQSYDFLDTAIKNVILYV